jgi:phosphate transport system substrate-binding protein
MRSIITKTVAVFAIAASAIVAAPAAQAGETVNGKGSSFANNFMQKCAREFNTATGNTVTYTSTGSSTGLSQYKAGAVEFAASDVPWSSGAPTEAFAYVPVTGGPVAIGFNVKGVKTLKLDPKTLAAIFKGTITTWDNAAIVKLNPSAKKSLKGNITVVYRDGSGTTANVQDYLNQTVGGFTASNANKNWDGAKGALASTSAVMVSTIKSTPGAIGYADLADVNVKLSYVSLKNAAGKYVKPTAAAGKKFISAQADPGKNGIVNINFKKKVKGGYNLSILTYLVIPKGNAPSGNYNAAEAGVVSDFAEYAVTTCGKKPAAGYFGFSTKSKLYQRALSNARSGF